MMTSNGATISPRGRPRPAAPEQPLQPADWRKPKPGSSAANTGKTSFMPKPTGTLAGNSAHSPNSPGKTTTTGTKAHGSRPARLLLNTKTASSPCWPSPRCCKPDGSVFFIRTMPLTSPRTDQPEYEDIYPRPRTAKPSTAGGSLPSLTSPPRAPSTSCTATPRTSAPTSSTPPAAGTGLQRVHHRLSRLRLIHRRPDIEGALHDVETGLRWLAQRRRKHPLYLGRLGGALGIALASEWVQRTNNQS